MIEKLLMMLDKMVEYFIMLSEKPFVTFTLIDLLLVIALGTGIFYFVKYSVKALVKYGIKGLLTASKPIAIVYVIRKEHRHNKRICHVCKNPLHKCTCQSNRGLSYHDKVKKWKITEKSLMLAKKEKELEKKKVNKPVDLKKKDGGK